MKFYGYVLFDLNSKNINKLYVTWIKCIYLWYSLSSYVSLLFDNIPIEAQLHKRYIKILSTVLQIENDVVQLCGKLMGNGSQSAVSKSFIIYHIIIHCLIDLRL